MKLSDDELANVIADLSLSDNEAVFTPPTIRKSVKRAAGRTGRSAFVSPICELHPDWEDESGTLIVANDDTHCAKFGHLPGRGRGVWQPSARRIILATCAELGKPLAVLALLIVGFYLSTQTLLGGGLLRSDDDVSEPTCAVSDSVGNAEANSPVRRKLGYPDRSNGGLCDVRDRPVSE